MKSKPNKIDRRDFFKTMGAAGLGSILAGKKIQAQPNQPKEKTLLPKVPRRVMGKTGTEVSAVALGTMFNLMENQMILRKSLEWGINYWDTAHSYAGGNSELGIGKFLKQNPDLRKDVFIVTKASRSKTIEEVEQRLQTSLKRMNTDYIDLYYGVHGLSDPAQLTDGLKQWAENAKKRGLIRYFGFSVHKNMAKGLTAAAKLDWIDGILTTYNFRVMQQPDLQAAIGACNKAGIGLTAMKTQGKQIETDEDKKLTEHFVKKGFTEGQAKLKVVLEDKRINSVAVGMNTIALLITNASAALDETKLSSDDKNFLRQYAQETCSGYCAGCGEICENSGAPYVSNIMRYMMYYNNYGDCDRARQLFSQIPAESRGRLLNTDYRLAQDRCPQKLPIARLVNEAVKILA